MNAATPYPAEAADARLDGRISSAEATFSAFTRLMDERQKAADERYRASEARMDRMEAMLAEIRASVASLRTTIVATGITSVFAVTAIVGTMQANLLASLGVGKDFALLQAEVKRQVEETAVLLKRVEEEKNHPTNSH